jgi:uncharacterized Fe-S cluster-containing protein
MERVAEIGTSLPGRNCGHCGFATCAELADLIARKPSARRRCIYLPVPLVVEPATNHEQETWRDLLGRDYQMVLEPYPEDPGPREQILPFDPSPGEQAEMKAGDVLCGRPAGIGCPVTHFGRLMAPADARSGALTWCLVGPVVSRNARSTEIGDYDIVAYEGLVRATRATPQAGHRFHFMPALCMLRARHSGVMTSAMPTAAGWRVRFEEIALA